MILRNTLRLLAAATMLCSVAQVAFGDNSPVVKSSVPLGVKVGKTTIVTVYGDNLAPKSVSTSTSGVSATLLGVKPTDDKTKSKGTTAVSVELNVSPTVPVQSIDVQLVQTGAAKLSASIALVDNVDDEAPVKKPASSFGAAMPVTSKSIAISGTLDGDTADVFRLEAHKGQTWDISLLAGRGGSQLDPVMRIRDSRHITLLLSAGDKKRDRHLLFRAPDDGAYYIDITDAEARGGAGFDYRLTVRALNE